MDESFEKIGELISYFISKETSDNIKISHNHNEQLKFNLAQQVQADTESINLLKKKKAHLEKEIEKRDFQLSRTGDILTDLDDEYFNNCQILTELEDEGAVLRVKLTQLKEEVKSLEEKIEISNLPSKNALFLELMRGFSCSFNDGKCIIVDHKKKDSTVYECTEENESIIMESIWKTLE